MAPRTKPDNEFKISVVPPRPQSVRFKIVSGKDSVVPVSIPHYTNGTDGIGLSSARRRSCRTRFKTLAKLTVRKSPKTFHHVVDEMFLGGTTGLDHLIRTHNNWFRFTIWLTAYVSLLSCLGYCVQCVLAKYFLYGTAISIASSDNDAMEFPAVTVCNLNFLRKSTFCRDKKIFEVFREDICTRESWTREDVFLRLSINSGVMNKSLEADSRSRVLDSVKEHTIHWEAVIKACHLARKNCLSSDLIKMDTSSNPEYGMCFTLFARDLRRNLTDDQRGEILEVEQTDNPSDGLHLVLDVNEEEYLPYQIEKGFVLMVHSHADAADVSRGGIYVPENRRTYVAIEKELVRLMEPPYDTGCQPQKTWPRKVLSLNPHLNEYLSGRNYSAVICEFICRAINVISVCNCTVRHGSFDYAMACVERLRRPGVETNFTCKDEFTRAPLETARKYNRSIKCSCPPKCKDAIFMKQVTYTHLRTETIYNNAHQRRKKYAEVFVYFKDITEEVMSVTPTYTYEKMMHEVGGFLGSFVGMAFMSVYEILESVVFTVLHIAPSRPNR